MRYLFEKHACNFAVLDQISSRLKALIHKSRTAAIVNDLRVRADPTTVCNAAFIALMGSAKHAIIGWNYKLLTALVLSPGLGGQTFKMHQTLLMEKLGAATSTEASCNTVVASAQDDGHRRDGDSRIIGTVVGAGAGGVLGNVIAGRGDKTEGYIIGAIVGAVIGNQVSKSDRGDCRRAYGYYDEQGRWHATGVSASEELGYYDRNNQWVGGAATGYYDVRGRWISTRVDNYQSNDNQYRPGTGPYDLGQMPTDVSTRIIWMREYVRSGLQSRRITQNSAQYARRELTAIEAQNRQFNRDGRLTQREAQMLEKRLDRLTKRFDKNWRQARNY